MICLVAPHQTIYVLPFLLTQWSYACAGLSIIVTPIQFLSSVMYSVMSFVISSLTYSVMYSVVHFVTYYIRFFVMSPLLCLLSRIISLLFVSRSSSYIFIFPVSMSSSNVTCFVPRSSCDIVTQVTQDSSRIWPQFQFPSQPKFQTEERRGWE